MTTIPTHPQPSRRPKHARRASAAAQRQQAAAASVRCSIRRSCGGRCATRSSSSSPRHMVRNPVMFVVLIGSAYTTVVFLRDVAQGRGDWGFTLQLALWLWFTVMFANFAEAMAEGRGKAQADTLRKSRTQTQAKRLLQARRTGSIDRTRYEEVSARGAASRRPRRLPPRRHHSRRRRGRRRRRVGGRERDHRRERAGHSRERRRSLGGHRRHEGAVRLHRHPHHGEPGRDLPRSHDRARRRRVATEDAERDRADDSACRA